MKDPYRVLPEIPKDAVERIRSWLKLPGIGSKVPSSSAKFTIQGLLSKDDQMLLERIRQLTSEWNRNNVTRTQAYLEYYNRHPEIHWALLAHMVSRNGGWSMTDLKGDILPRLLAATKIEHFFSFLELSNASIFYDAFPQLLLYEESLKQHRNLFALLPKLGVSRFMEAVWNEFWETRNSQLVTVAMIINEQQYIERRVVQNPIVQKYVFQTFEFQAQAILHLTTVIFPCTKRFRGRRKKTNVVYEKVFGSVVESFTKVEERIRIGKKLYAILFSHPHRLDAILTFAKSVPHTGSRADYWPNVFSTDHLSETISLNVPRGAIHKQSVKAGVQCFLDRINTTFHPLRIPILSPKLTDAWSDRPFTKRDHHDWFVDLSDVDLLTLQHVTVSQTDVTQNVKHRLRKLQLAADLLPSL